MIELNVGINYYCPNSKIIVGITTDYSTESTYYRINVTSNKVSLSPIVTKGTRGELLHNE